MPFRLDLTSKDDRLPNLETRLNKSNKIEILDDKDFTFDLNLSARLNPRDSLEDDDGSVKSDATYSKGTWSPSLSNSESTVSSVKSNSTLSIRDYDALKVDRSATRTRNTLDEIIKRLEDGPTEVAMDIHSEMSETELHGLYKTKYEESRQENDRLHEQVKYHRKVVEDTQSELAAQKVKSAALKETMNKLKMKMKDGDGEKDVLRSDIETLQEKNSRLSKHISSLQKRTRDAEEKSTEHEATASKLDLKLAAMSRDMKHATEKRHQLEQSLKHHLQSTDDFNKEIDHWKGKYENISMELCSLLGVDTTTEKPEEEVLAKTTELVKENTIILKKLEKVVNSVQSSKEEAKASRETIMQLVNDVSKEQKAANEMREEAEAAKKERDLAKYSASEKKSESKRLREQLEQSQKAWNKTRKELDEKIDEIDKLSNDLKEERSQSSHQKLLHFRRHLANILTDDLNTVKDDEEMILQHVTELQVVNKKLTKIEDMLTSKLKLTKKDATTQKKIQQTALERVVQAEEDYKNVEDRLKELEGDLLATEVERKDLHDERRKYMKFLDSLAQIMKLDIIALDAGFDLTADALLARGEQLVKKDTDTVHDRTHTIYSLQRKIKQLNEKVESKDLALNVAKKKCSELEDQIKENRNLNESAAADSNKMKKLKKKLERTQAELSSSKETVQDLKASLSDLNGLRDVNQQQKKVIQDLESSVDRLAKSKHKTSKQLKGAKEKMDSSVMMSIDEVEQLKEQLTSSQSNMEASSAKLKEVENREAQLLEFRDLLAQLVGLDVNKMAVPDFEIMQRVESLVKAHASYTEQLERTLADLKPLAS